MALETPRAGPGPRARRPAVPAPHWPRFAATVVDGMLVSLLVLPALLLTEGADTTVRLGALLIAAGLPTFLVEGMVGRSPGKAALGLRHAQRDEAGPTDLAFLPRWGLKWLTPLVFVAIGLAPAALAWWLLDYAPALRGERRTVHDRVAGTRVLQQPALAAE